jgi:hypothetical protein
MTLRRALWTAPLAVSIAVLAHLAVFGLGHAPGAAYAPELLGSLGAALLLGLLGAFLGGAVGRAQPVITTERRFGYAPLLLAGAAAGTFALIELLEGHVAAAPLLLALAASLPLALGVLRLSGAARRAAHDAGHRLAVYLERAARAARPAAFLLRGPGARAFAPAVVRGSRRGRAPPALIGR